MKQLKNTKTLLVLLIILFLGGYAKAENTPSFNIVKKGNGKQAVILIPGYACPGRVWNETVKKLSSGNTFYVVTFAGFAGQKAQADPSLKQWENDLAAYIRENKIEKPVIVGHSLGGVMAYMLAADYPDLVSKIVIVDGLPCLSAMYNPDFKAKENPDCSIFVNMFGKMDDKQFEAQQKKSIPMLIADTTMVDTIVNWSAISDRKTEALIYCQFSNTDMRDKLAGIKCPALVLLEAPFKDYDGAVQKQFSQLKTGTLKYANKGLHFIMFDDKDWYLEQVNTFLN